MKKEGVGFSFNDTVCIYMWQKIGPVCPRHSLSKESDLQVHFNSINTVPHKYILHLRNQTNNNIDETNNSRQ